MNFLRENGAELFMLIYMAIWWLCLGLFSIKGDIKSLDKKRADRGMTNMTDDEKQLVKEAFRSSILSNFLQVIIAGVVALIIMNLF